MKPNLNRRQFIRNGASALAGTALAPVVATEKWSRTARQPPQPQLKTAHRDSTALPLATWISRY